MSHKFPFYYTALGVKPTCTVKEITEAWETIRKKEKQNSPALYNAERAKNFLLDPSKRYRYNTNGADDINFSAVHDHIMISPQIISNTYVNSFLTGQNFKKFQDINEDIFLTLNDMYCGKQMELTLKTKQKIACTHCLKQQPLVPCSKCTASNINLPEVVKNCLVCKGLGMVAPVCLNCKGQKMTYNVVTLPIQIEKGIRHNQKITISGKGHSVIGYGHGDVVLTVKQIMHKVFKRCGNDLWMRKRIGITAALCGRRFAIKQLDGRKLLTNKISVNFNTEKVIEGEGMPLFKNSNSECGNLIIVFEVTFPNSLPVEKIEEIATFLPKRPKLVEEPDLEEYTLVDFDPTVKPHPVSNMYQQYTPKKTDPSVPTKDNQCAQQ